MRSFVGALVLLLAPTLATAQPALSLQEALLRAKPAVALVVSEVGGDVLVRCGAGAETTVTPSPFRETGTGWFVASSGWLVTNGHVVSPAHNPPGWLANEQTQKAIKQTCGAGAGSGRARLEPSISVLLANGVRMSATVVKYSPPVAGEAMSGQDLALLKLEAADMPVLPLADSAQAQIGDRLHIIGFPGVVLSHELLNSSAKMEASVTGGAVSGFKQDRANQLVIQTDASAAWGNSGGPAVNDVGAVVGVLTFVTLSSDAQSNIVQGFNFIIPSAAVVKFLEGTPVPRGEPNRFNAAWHAGLRDHFAGNYRRARAELAEANRLLPELPDVRRITLENDERLKREPLLPWTSWSARRAGRSCCFAGGSATASGSAPRKSCGFSRGPSPRRSWTCARPMPTRAVPCASRARSTSRSTRWATAAACRRTRPASSSPTARDRTN